MGGSPPASCAEDEWPAAPSPGSSLPALSQQAPVMLPDKPASLPAGVDLNAVQRWVQGWGAGEWRGTEEE